MMEELMDIKLRRDIALALRHYRKWVADGLPIPNDHSFAPDTGLCVNLILHPKLYYGGANLVYRELRLMFREDGLNYVYPFNEGEGFTVECELRTIHLNAKRMAWVDKIIETYGV